MLVNSAETAFAAFWLLPWLNDDTQYIYTDTSAINALAYATVMLKQEILSTWRAPFIDSFGSWEGVNKFVFERNALVLVSASTSGSLEKLLINDKGISKDRIVTILSAHNHAGKATPLCDLLKFGTSVIINEPPTDCTHCKRNVPIIKIIGEHFLPGNPNIRTEQLTAQDCPADLQTFMAEVAERRILRVNHTPLRATRTEPYRELFIDVQALVATGQQNYFTTKIDRALQRVPATLDRIIHQDDDGSRALAERIQTTVAGLLARTPTLIKARDVFRNHQQYTTNTGTTLVVAGATCSGKHLLQISQILRYIQQNGSVQYLVGIGKTGNKHDFQELKSNLQYGECAADHDFQIITNLQLPQDSTVRPNAWLAELEALQDWQHQYQQHPEFLRVIEERLQHMAQERRTGGLLNTLFWPAVNQHDPLRLTEGFSFWNQRYDRERVTQADVYFTIATVLHSLREGLGRQRHAWAQQATERVLLAPGSFLRFNDGVIQASLLRAAQLPEIDYSISAQHSEAMADQLYALFQNRLLPVGEATTEFAWALASGRLRLCPADYAQLISVLQEDPSPTIQLFTHAITRRLSH